MNKKYNIGDLFVVRNLNHPDLVFIGYCIDYREFLCRIIWTHSRFECHYDVRSIKRYEKENGWKHFPIIKVAK